MGSDDIPRWISQFKDETARVELDWQREISVQALIHAGKLSFWNKLAGQLRLAIDSCKKAGIVESIEFNWPPWFASDDKSEIQHSVAEVAQILIKGKYPHVRYTELVVTHYRAWNHIGLSSSVLHREKIHLGVSPRGEVRAIGPNGRLLDAEQVAEGLLSPLLRYACRLDSHV